MKTIRQLYNGFYLDKESANSQISNCPTSLRVAPVEKMDTYKKLEIEKDNFAFAEKNIKWEIEYFHGLKNFLWIEKSDFSPIFIFDNHNHAPVFRYYSMKQRNKDVPTLIHIDQHSDCRENKEKLEIDMNEYDLEKVFHFYNEKCNVWNFIPPSQESWIISDQIQIRSTTALKNLNINQGQNFILDIDLDFCLDWIGRNMLNEDAVKILKEKFDKIWKSALCITIATSPYFLDQEVAIKIVRELIN